jgi:hypothetical protein
MIVVIGVIVVLAIGGAFVVARKSRRDALAAEAGVGPNELLRAPPTSFPGSTPPPGADRPAAGAPDDDIVIDLVEIEAASAAARSAGDDPDATSARVLEPEPDVAEHVLQALINRARFRQVGVEEVASALVERADERGQDVSEMLAELVGGPVGATPTSAPVSELTLFNDAVPSRPGQLTDLTRLAPDDKKRLIVRVLCLLVARSEDQQLPPRRDRGPSVEPKAWPLARAAWPVATGAGAAVSKLPSRRLAKSS